MEPEQAQVAVRAAVQALDAALAEHRRRLAMAAGRRERERMAHGRAVKAAAAESERALDQPVERPMRLLRLAETWIEVDRARHRLDATVHAVVEDGELRVSGDGWTARIALAPGGGPAAAARAAAARIEAAGPAAGARARERVEKAVAAGLGHAAACHATAAALAAADRELAERHADHARVESSAAELADRLGAWRLGEAAEVAAARDRLEQARAHLAAAPEQPYAWIEGHDPAVTGALLRDLPADRLDAARPAATRLAGALHGAEPLLALAATDHLAQRRADPVADRPGAAGIVAVTSERVLIAGDAGVQPWDAARVEADGDRLLAAGGELASGLVQLRPGRLAAALELVRAARAAGPPPPPPPPAEPGGDPLEALRRLGELRDGGVIEQAEFEAKKAELLRRI
jgi:hypothetical protein